MGVDITSETILDILKKSENPKKSDFEFEVKFNEKHTKVTIYVTWIRTERLSLTIRNVKKAKN